MVLPSLLDSAQYQLLYYQQHDVRTVIPAKQPQSCKRRFLLLADLFSEYTFSKI